LGNVIVNDNIDQAIYNPGWIFQPYSGYYVVSFTHLLCSSSPLSLPFYPSPLPLSPSLPPCSSYSYLHQNNVCKAVPTTTCPYTYGLCTPNWNNSLAQTYEYACEITNQTDYLNRTAFDIIANVTRYLIHLFLFLLFTLSFHPIFTLSSPSRSFNVGGTNTSCSCYLPPTPPGLFILLILFFSFFFYLFAFLFFFILWIY
jgi:hypothetical protein